MVNVICANAAKAPHNTQPDVTRAPVRHWGSPLVGGRSYFGNRYVYAVISQRARGLSIGVNLNPDQRCNFDCLYCEIDRTSRSPAPAIDLQRLSEELTGMLHRACAGGMSELPGYEAVPAELLKLKEVTLSGDGEPTLCPDFPQVVETVLHLRARGMFPFFKIVVITNATCLQEPAVRDALLMLTTTDDIWVKLDAGTEAYFAAVNRPNEDSSSDARVTLEQITANIIELARLRPVVIQSLFPSIDGRGPQPDEVEAYASRVRRIKEAGGKIKLVQVYSAHRPPVNRACGHLPLRNLSEIARRVREVAGVPAEVF